MFAARRRMPVAGCHPRSLASLRARLAQPAGRYAGDARDEPAAR